MLPVVRKNVTGAAIIAETFAIATAGAGADTSACETIASMVQDRIFFSIRSQI